MGRNLKTKRLGVWMNGERVGTWSILASGKHEFHYEKTWLDLPETRPISLSLPLATADYSYTGLIVEAFFENLNWEVVEKNFSESI